MASTKWHPLRDRFRALLGVLRWAASVKDQLPEDSFDDAVSALDDIVYSYPDEIFSELNDELEAVNEADAESIAGTGPITPLQTGMPIPVAMKQLASQIEALTKQVEALAASDEDSDEDEDEDGEGGEDEDADESEAKADEPAAPKALGEAGPGKSQTYRGDIRAIVGVGGHAAFVTVHPEGAPTALYWLDVDKLSMQQDALACGGVALAADGNTVYVGGTDRHLYECGKKAPKNLAGPFAADIVAIVPLSKKRIAVLHGKQIDIISDKDGAVQQTLELPDTGTCLSADKSGSWLAAGTTKGIVAVFDGQDKDEFEPGDSAKLHDGAVTVVAFEPEELRFFSAGADNKLLTTFARGSLEPEDKGRANMHEDVLTALVLVPGDRFVTGSRDATLKNWPRPGAIKPSTLKDTVGRVVGLAVVTVYNQPHVAVACDDNSIRLVKLEPDGKFPDDDVVSAKVTGAADWVREELSQTHDPRRREKALKSARGVERLREHRHPRRTTHPRPGPQTARDDRGVARRQRQPARRQDSRTRDRAQRWQGARHRVRGAARAHEGRPRADRPGAQDRTRRCRHEGGEGARAAGARRTTRRSRGWWTRSTRRRGTCARRRSRRSKACTTRRRRPRASPRSAPRTATSAARRCCARSSAGCSKTPRCSRRFAAGSKTTTRACGRSRSCCRSSRSPTSPACCAPATPN